MFMSQQLVSNLEEHIQKIKNEHEKKKTLNIEQENWDKDCLLVATIVGGSVGRSVGVNI